MPHIVRDLPSVTFSSGATNSPAIAILDDTSVLAIWVGTSGTTSTGTFFTVQGEQSDTGTNFLSLSLNVAGSSGIVGITVPATGALILSNVAFRQFRLTATGAVNNALQIFATKQISV